MLTVVIIAPLVLALFIALAGLVGYRYVEAAGSNSERAYAFTMKLMYIALGIGTTSAVDMILLIIAYGVRI